MHNGKPDIPIVMLSGLDDKGLALRAVHEGARDCLVKGQVNSHLLDRAIHYAIERNRTRREIKELNASLKPRVLGRTRELHEANEKLQVLERLKSEFINVTSHEVKIPLTIIKGLFHIVKNQPADVEFIINPGIRAVDRLEKTIARVISISQSGQYEVKLNKTTVHFGGFTEDVSDEVLPVINSRNQKLEFNIPDDLPPIQIDRDKIRGVILNLIMNAIKLTLDGGTIRLSVNRRNEDALECRVIDPGIGISEEDKPHLFKEFSTSLDTNFHSSGEQEFGKRGVGFGHRQKVC
jgi:signal transduction histidine kinase